MPKQEIYGTVDLGSNQIACVIGKSKDGIIEVLGGAKADASKGIKNGVIISIQDAANAIRMAVENAETKSGHTVKKLYVALRGKHIESLDAHGTQVLSRTDKEISADDVNLVNENANMSIRLSNDREIIHAISQSFTVNNQTGIPNPVGMDGTHLEVDLHVIAADSGHINNIAKTIARAGFDVEGFVYGYLALGQNIVTQEEKDLGALLVDIGATSTGIVTYKNGLIQSSMEIELGGDYITKDIAHFLKTKGATAAQIKEKYGYASKKNLKSEILNHEIVYKGMDGKAERKVKTQEIIGVIDIRIDQLIDCIKDALGKKGIDPKMFTGGAIVSGGTSMLKNLDLYFEDHLAPSVRTGMIYDVNGDPDIINDPSYFTAISLLEYHLGEVHTARERTRSKKSIFGLFKKIFDGNF